MKNTSKFYEAVADALNIIEEVGMDTHCISHYNYKITNSKRNYGSCHYLAEEIRISNRLLESGWEEELTNTLIHEMLHAYAYEVYECGGHTGEWKRLANLITELTPYKISRLAEKSMYKKEDKKYVITCEKCGCTFGYHRKTKLAKLLENGERHYFSHSCGGKEFSLKIN